MNCRCCGNKLYSVFIDLGHAPLPNCMRTSPDQAQAWYPLRMYRCTDCDLIQTCNDIPPSEIFNDDYPYFSSRSEEDYWAEYAQWVWTNYEPENVIEIASNDGYLLKHLAGVTEVMGYEPCNSVAREAIRAGIETAQVFFNEDTAGINSADVIIANNVLAHTPDPVGMMKAIAKALKPDGVAIIEFPDVKNLVERLEWDTCYHEHYSCLSLKAVDGFCQRAGLVIQDWMETPIHGGSLRVTVGRGQPTPVCYDPFDVSVFRDRVRRHKRRIVNQVNLLRAQGKSIVGFGAAAKAATLLNSCGLADSVEFIADDTPWKQGKYLSGTSIPIVRTEELEIAKPDVVWIFPWNFEDKIKEKLSYIRLWEGQFLVTGGGQVELSSPTTEAIL